MTILIFASGFLLSLILSPNLSLIPLLILSFVLIKSPLFTNSFKVVIQLYVWLGLAFPFLLRSELTIPAKYLNFDFNLALQVSTFLLYLYLSGYLVSAYLTRARNFPIKTKKIYLIPTSIKRYNHLFISLLILTVCLYLSRIVLGIGFYNIEGSVSEPSLYKSLIWYLSTDFLVGIAACLYIVSIFSGHLKTKWFTWLAIFIPLNILYGWKNEIFTALSIPLLITSSNDLIKKQSVDPLIINWRQLIKSLLKYSLILTSTIIIFLLFLVSNSDARNVLLVISTRFASLFRDGLVYDHLNVRSIVDLISTSGVIKFSSIASIQDYFLEVNKYVNTEVYGINEDLAHRVGLNLNTGLTIGNGGLFCCIILLLLGFLTCYCERLLARNLLTWPITPFFYMSIFKLLTSTYQITLYRSVLIAFIGVFLSWLWLKPIPVPQNTIHKPFITRQSDY